jgi:hypothetical protein
MKKILTKVFISGVLVGVFGVAIYFIGKDNDTPSHTGPEVIVRDFTEAMKTGDFEKARSLCDTSAMQEYLDAYMQKWETKSLKDSAAFASTVRILGETTIEIDKVDMLDGVCFIDYTLGLDGNIRKCHAGLKKEEGEWKVTEITDRN